MNIARFSVKNAFLVNIITVFILIVGFVSLVQIQREAFPNVNFDIVNITTLFPGASPQEVEKLVTIPLEKEIREVDGIDEMTSVSVEGVSIITLELDPNARNTDRILNDISQATNRVEDLPFEAEVPIVEEVTTQNSPIIQIAMSGPFTELQLQQHAKRLEDRFLDLPGVASITRRGWRDKEIWVEAYPEKLKEQHIAIDEIVDALRTKNVSVSGGTLKSKKEEFLIRTVGEFETPEEIEEVVIRANDLGNWVKIKDVARVRAEFEDAKQLFRANGYPAIGLVVIKKAAFDVIDMVESVRREIAVFQNTAPPQLKMTEIDDISFYVKRRLSVLLRGGSIGFVLVLLVLALFMNPVAALMTALGIPFALCFVLICMPSMGITLNLLSMFGLIMMLGLLVDDAIVVSENVLRYTEQGEKPKHAAVRGTTEVIPAILTTVGTTMAAFFPLLFLPGIIGKFIRVIPIVVLIALIASLFEAFIVLPSHLGEFMEEKWRAWLERFHLDRWSHSVLNSLKNKYERAVRLILSHRFKVVSAFFILLIAIVIYAKVGMKFILFPARGIEEFTIQVEAPIGTSIEQLQQYLQPLEEEIQKLPEEELEDFVIQLGIKGFDTGDDPYVERGTHLAMGIVYLTPDKSRKREAQEIMNELKEKTKNLSGFSSIKYEKVRSGPPVGKPVSIRVRGDDIDVLKRIAGKIKEQLGTVDGVQGIEDSYEGGKKEIRVNIDEQKAAQSSGCLCPRGDTSA